MSSTRPGDAIRHNGAWLLVLPMGFNTAFHGRLPESFGPEHFDVGVPAWVLGAEFLTRAATFGLPFIARMAISTATQRIGATVYVLGLVVYFASWGTQIAWPDSSWSQSVIGFTAPAWTPALWLTGVYLLLEGPLFAGPRRLRQFFAVSAIAFLVVHITHAALAYPR